MTLEAIYIGPAWAAKFESGTRGTYTVTSCERLTCWGTFVSDDGRDTKPGMIMGSGSGRLQPGQQVPALDTGNPLDVYPANGGNDWLFFTLLLLLTFFGVGTWIRIGPIEERRERRRTEAAQARVDSMKVRPRSRSIGRPRFDNRRQAYQSQDQSQLDQRD